MNWKVIGERFKKIDPTSNHLFRLAFWEIKLSKRELIELIKDFKELVEFLQCENWRYVSYKEKKEETIKVCKKYDFIFDLDYDTRSNYAKEDWLKWIIQNKFLRLITCLTCKVEKEIEHDAKFTIPPLDWK